MPKTDINQYQNADGTYTSPSNGRIYMSKKSFISHLSFRKTDKTHTWSNYNREKVNCQFCGDLRQKSNIKRHELYCYLNPKNITYCKVCLKPIKNFKTNKATCSRSCSNTYYRKGEGNGNWKSSAYRSTCFLYHKKECVVCGESNIIEVHHYDGNKNNNNPSNLIPLCPTHHQYWHSKYRQLIESIVNLYINNWNNNRV